MRLTTKILIAGGLAIAVAGCAKSENAATDTSGEVSAMASDTASSMASDVPSDMASDTKTTGDTR